MKKTLTILFCLQGCLAADPPTDEDGQNDSFTGDDGKADSGGVAEGSYEALAVLDLATTESPDVLLEPAPDGVGLSERVVDNLMNLRLGDDGRPGTADDVVFESLAQLDAVPFIGAIAFRKMRDHVAEHPRCFAENFGTHQRLIDEMVLARTHVYFMSDPNTYPIDVWRIGKDSPRNEKIADLTPGNGYEPALAVDATHVYLSNALDLERRPLAGGDVELFDRGVGGMGAATTDAMNVYYGDDAGIYRRAKSGGMRERIVQHPQQAWQYRSTKIVADGATVYWLDNGDMLTRGFMGGPRTPIATNVRDFAVDATHVYVLTNEDVLDRKFKTNLADDDRVAYQTTAFALVDEVSMIVSQPDGLVVRKKENYSGENKLTVTNPKGQLFTHVAVDPHNFYWMSDRPHRLNRYACRL